MTNEDAGSGGAAFPFSPQDALAFLSRMWNPLGVPIPGLALPGTPAAASPAAGMQFPNPAAMFAALDPGAIERKIEELRVIENWLAMSLNMMQMSIKTLELQKASLEALQAGQRPRAEPPPAESSPSRPRARKG